MEIEDEEMEEFVMQLGFEGVEVDMDYEFDAPKFYDFTWPETYSEAEEAQDWFRYAGGYPPSPLIVKLLNWQKGIQPDGTAKTSCTELKDIECIRSVSADSNNSMEAEVSSVQNQRVRCSNEMAQDSPKAKTKLPVLLRSSTLMKPTASHLAKQNQHRREVRVPHSNRVSRRVEKLGKLAENSQNSHSFNVATKRQKLEAGYLGKVAQLKHQPLWSHKEPKKVVAGVKSPNGRPKVTVPREPNLETAQRAQRHRYKSHAKDGEQTNIIKEPPWSLPRKSSTSQAKDFQVFHFSTLERAKQSTSVDMTNTPTSSCLSPTETAEIKGPNSSYAKRDKCIACSLKKKTLSSKEGIGVLSNIKQENRLPSPRELKFSTDKRLIKEPPTELFSKLSIGPEAHQHSTKPEFKLPMPAEVRIWSLKHRKMYQPSPLRSQIWSKEKETG